MEKLLIQIIVLAIQALAIYFTVKLAQKKGRRAEVWAVVAFVCSWIGFGALYSVEWWKNRKAKRS